VAGFQHQTWKFFLTRKPALETSSDAGSKRDGIYIHFGHRLSKSATCDLESRSRCRELTLRTRWYRPQFALRRLTARNQKTQIKKMQHACWLGITIARQTGWSADEYAAALAGGTHT